MPSSILTRFFSFSVNLLPALRFSLAFLASIIDCAPVVVDVYESLAVRVGVSWQERRETIINERRKVGRKEGVLTTVRSLLAMFLALGVRLAAILLAVRTVVGCKYKTQRK